MAAVNDDLRFRISAVYPPSFCFTWSLGGQKRAGGVRAVRSHACRVSRYEPAEYDLRVDGHCAPASARCVTFAELSWFHQHILLCSGRRRVFHYAGKRRESVAQEKCSPTPVLHAEGVHEYFLVFLYSRGLRCCVCPLA